MRAGGYPYPADEFDAAATAEGPRGVHRAPRSWWSHWWPFVVVVVVFPALAYGVVTWLSDWNGLPGADAPASQSEDGQAAPETTGEATEPAAPSVTPTPTPQPDLARTVEVFNATSRAGLAGGGVDRLKAAGFTAVTSGNWSGEDPAASVVYYPASDDVATAQMVASTLGIGTVEESAEVAPAGIVAVLADDYVAG